MADKSWMLNPKAIRHANECIQLIKERKGIRLKLSQPDFIQQLHQHVEKIGGRELGEAYAQLLSMAGVGSVLSILEKEPAEVVAAMPVAVGDNIVMPSSENVQIDGKVYPRFRKGREFRGIFHGVPRYR